jgi:serine/threonine-protein kinase
MHPETIGKYRIESELGRGGMGVVYRAFDPVIERHVALKTVLRSQIPATESEEFLRRFRREAQAAGRLMHPNIVGVYEYGEEEGTAFIAMEFVSGQGLDVMLQEGALAPQQARPLIAQMLDALHYAHGLGVVHRDIKPANLIITADGKVKVSDFGIALIANSDLTQVGTVLGTPSYMSPEQLRGNGTDARSDIYSAAVVIYQMLTGVKPFQAETMAALIYAVLHHRPDAPTTAHPGIDANLDSPILRGLDPDRMNRYADAAAFARAMEAAFDGRVAEEALHETTIRTVAHSEATVVNLSVPKLRKIDLSAVTRRIDVTTVSRAGLGAVPASARPRVLFVDDEDRILSSLRALFRQDVEVHTTTDAHEALKMLAESRFHVIVSDQRMPIMNGTELLSRAKTVAPSTVRILLTGYSDLAALIGSVNEGEVYRFASKPWNGQELRDLVAEAAAVALALEEAPIAAAPEKKAEEAVLIVDEDREVFLAARDLFGAAYRVLHAPDLAGVLQNLRDEKIAVLVSDIEGKQSGSRTLFKMLKQEHPEILTIAMTSASDSELVIELINKARIYRFLNKPIKLATLHKHVEAAMAQFQKQKRQPSLLRSQQAAKADQVEERGSVGSLILGSLRALRSTLIRA